MAAIQVLNSNNGFCFCSRARARRTWKLEPPTPTPTPTVLSKPFLKRRRRSASHLQVRVKAAVSNVNGKQLIESGKVQAILPKAAASAVGSQGFLLLDIRPIWEWEKARVSGSLHVPLFVQDMDNSPITLLKKWVHFGYIGAWTGQKFTTTAPDFVQQVEKLVPDKDTKLLVACGEGLRSIMATSKLYAGGYRNLGWLVGGFNRISDDDFPATEGTEKLQYATIGGASYYFLQLLILLQAVGKN